MSSQVASVLAVNERLWIHHASPVLSGPDVTQTHTETP